MALSGAAILGGIKAAGSFASGLGTLAGGIGSIFGGSGGTSVYKSAQLQKHQEKMQEKYLRNYYQNARYSLEQANYNPVLAYMNTPSGGQTSAVANEGNSAANMVGLANAGINAKRAFDNEQKQTESTINLQNAQRHNIEQDTMNKEVQHGILELDKQIRGYESEMRKFDKDSQQYRFYQEMKEMASRTKLNLQTAMYVGYNAESNRISANAMATNAATTKERMQIETAPQKRYNQWVEDNPVLGSTSETVERFLPGAVGVVNSVTGMKNAVTNAKKLDYDEGYLLQRFGPNGEFKGHSRVEKKKRHK